MTSFLSETTYVGISMMGMSFGMNLVLGQHLPFLIGIHTIAATIVVILVCCLEETPKYLLIKRNDREAALKSLEFYRGATDENQKVMDSIEKEAKEGFAAPFPASISIILRTRHLRQAFLVGFCCMQVSEFLTYRE
ncbi:unnamed protein product [Anisakis simplex]|uniref:MFS domain-containing protein n=1 Tax=Anisakis simplex TaxID=6269 RepID=A0A0M3J8M5_ANISI|nr:unnamed protein product [Anisakis simplex]